jgi:hypothetical protein
MPEPQSLATRIQGETSVRKDICIKFKDACGHKKLAIIYKFKAVHKL